MVLVSKEWLRRVAFRLACEDDGGATLYVHDRVAAYVKNDHTTAQFPEVVAIEFDKAFFSASSNVIVVVAYISCSELAAAKKYIDVHHTTQLAALSELLCNFRAAGYQVLFFSDVNGYVLDFNGYDGCESEYDAEIDATTFSGVDLPLRRVWDVHVLRYATKIEAASLSEG